MLDKIVELAPVQMLDGRHVEVFLSTEYWEAFAVDSCDAVAWWEYRGIRVAVNRYQDIDAVVNVNE